MANKKWQEANLAILIPALSELGTAQEEQIAQLCEKEIAGWRARPSIKKESALRPLMSASRKAIEERIKLTHDNRWKNPRSGKWEHLALKYMNFTEEEWRSLNAISDEKFQERQEQRQFIDHPAQIVARAEKLLSSNRWEDLVTGLAITTGRRLTEILKTARFFPKSLYSVTFDGQLKVRQDLDLKPYEIPLLCPAEVVIQAWRRLRSLEDCTGLDKDQVAQKYSRPANENVNYHFTGLIPQKTTRDKLTTHGMRGVYARIAVSWFCPATPVLVSDLSYVNAILGHWQATTERQMRDFATTEHYFDYVIGDGAGNIDGRQGIRLQEPGVEILEEFNHTKGTTMTDTTTTQEQAQNTQKGKAKSSASRTKEPKTRGTLTVQAGSYDIFCTKMEERGIHGDWKHDAMLVDVMNHDAVAHQMYTLLAPLSEDLGTDGPIATLQALIHAHQNGGSTKVAPGMAELLEQVRDKPEPVAYLKGLVERDRKFWEGIDNRSSKVDVATASMEDLRNRIKTPEAATERFRRAVDAIIAHNNVQTDPLHFWFINAREVRNLVGGKNELVQAYLETRRAEIDAHHNQYGLTPRANKKNMEIKDEVKVQ